MKRAVVCRRIIWALVLALMLSAAVLCCALAEPVYEWEGTWSAPYVRKTETGYKVGATFRFTQAGDIYWDEDGRIYVEGDSSLLYNGSVIQSKKLKVYAIPSLADPQYGDTFDAELRFSLPESCAKGTYVLRWSRFHDQYHGGPFTSRTEIKVEVSDKLEESGTCGEDMTWTLDGDGVLTINGTGIIEYGEWPKEKIRSIQINGAAAIGNSAFQGCSGVTGITIPASVKIIEANAFSECTGLKKITIPETVEEVWRGAFNGCSGLISAKVNSQNEYFDFSGAFQGCSALTEVIFPSGHPHFRSINGVVYSKDKKTLVFCPAAKKGAFTIPDHVNYVQSGAFAGCKKLTKVNIPDSVIWIEMWAFSGCSGLKDMVLPDGLTMIDYECFAHCTGLKRITIPGSVTSISGSAFSGCSKLADIYYGGSKAKRNQIENIDELLAQIPKVKWHYAKADRPDITITGSHCVAKGKKIQLKAKVTPKDADQEVIWTSSNKKIASVSKTGVVKGLKAGDVKITATLKSDSTVSRSFVVTVARKPVSKITIDSAPEKLKVGETVFLYFAIEPYEASYEVKWQSSDKKIATINQYGELKAISPGVVKITVTAMDGSGKKATVKIRIKA